VFGGRIIRIRRSSERGLIICLALSNAGFGHFPAAYSPIEDRETEACLPDTRVSDAATLSNSRSAFTLRSVGRASEDEDGDKDKDF
jgi:hypothetical protein